MYFFSLIFILTYYLLIIILIFCPYFIYVYIRFFYFLYTYFFIIFVFFIIIIHYYSVYIGLSGKFADFEGKLKRKRFKFLISFIKSFVARTFRTQYVLRRLALELYKCSIYIEKKMLSIQLKYLYWGCH